MKIILFFSLIILFVVILYYVARYLIKLYTGYDDFHAGKVIQNFVTRTSPYHLAEDNMFISEMWENIHALIGESNFRELELLATTSDLVYIDMKSNIPCIGFTVICNDELQKRCLYRRLSAILKKYLQMHDMYDKFLVGWKTNYELELPMLVFGYAETQEQEKLVLKHIMEARKHGKRKK